MSSPMMYDPTVVPDYQGQQPNQLMRLAGLGTPNFQRSPATANAINAIANIGRQPQGQQPATPNMMNQLMPLLLRRAMTQREQTPTPVGSDPAPGTTTRMSDSPPSDTPAGVQARIKLDQTAVGGGYEVPINPTQAAQATPTTTPEVQQRAAATPPAGTPAVPNPATPAPPEDAPHGFTVNTAGSPHPEGQDQAGQLNIHVTPTDDQMLHWNKPYEDQPQQVQGALSNMYPGRDMSGRTGAQIYNQDVGNEMVTNGTMYSQARAGVSQYYHDNGIPGSILQDGSTKQATVFHPSNISYSANGYQLEPVDYTPNFRQGGAIDSAINRQTQANVYPNTPAADVPPPPPPFITPTPIVGQ